MSNTDSNSYEGSWLETIQWLLSIVVIAVFVISFMIQAFQIPTESMENTLLIGDYLLVDKVRFGANRRADHWLLPYRPVNRGDIIVFHYPVNPAQHFVKRVIGIPGDHIHFLKKTVYINGTPLPETYTLFSAKPPDNFRDNFPRLDQYSPEINSSWLLRLRRPGTIAGGDLVVPPGNYFVLGDNRDDSLDSRYWGFVPEANIIGRPLLIYWSLNNTNVGLPASASLSDKMLHLTCVITHLFRITRWERTFRLVR